MDETYTKVKGQWSYLYRAVRKQGNTVDFLLTKRRQRISAQSFFTLAAYVINVKDYFYYLK